MSFLLPAVPIFMGAGKCTQSSFQCQRLCALELSNVHRVLPVLAEAETANWTEEESVRKWGTLVGDLKRLTGTGMADDNGLQLALAIASVTFVDAAKSRLLQGGLTEERVSKIASHAHRTARCLP